MFYDEWYKLVTKQLIEWNENFTDIDILEREKTLKDFLNKTFQEHYVYSNNEITDRDREFAQDICKTYIEKIEKEPNTYDKDFIYKFFFKKFPEGITIDEIRKHPILKEALAEYYGEFCYNNRHGMQDNLLMIVSSDKEEFHKLAKIWCKQKNNISGPAENIDTQFALLNYCTKWMEDSHPYDDIMKYLKNIPWKHLIDLYFTYLGIDEKGMEAFNKSETYTALNNIAISKFNSCDNDGTFNLLPKNQQQIIIQQSYSNDKLIVNECISINEEARLQNILSYKSLKLFLAYCAFDFCDSYTWKQKNKTLKAIAASVIIVKRKQNRFKVAEGLIKNAGKFYNIIKLNPDIKETELLNIIKEDKEVKELFPNE